MGACVPRAGMICIDGEYGEVVDDDCCNPEPLSSSPGELSFGMKL